MKINGLNLKLKKIIKYIRICLRASLHFIYFLTCFLPRDERIWIFGSGATGNRFADNAKYLFLYVANNFPNKIKSIWISQSREIVKELKKNGYRAYWNNSPGAIFFSLRAKYFIIDLFSSTFGSCYWFSGKAKKINLWHGIPLKKIGYDDDKSIIYKPNWFRKIIFRIFIPWTVEKYDVLVSTSPLFKEILTKAFRINKKNVVVAGHPRNDVFFKKIKNYLTGEEYKHYLDLIKIKKKTPLTKFLVYVPTYRDTRKDFLMDVGMKRLDGLLASYNSFLIIKPHPYTEIKAEEWRFSNIGFLSPSVDIYPFLPIMDLLITDYSSIYFDFLLVNKPIIFFPFDLEKYQTKDRKFYFDYDKFTPGPKAYNFEKLINWIEYFLKGNDDFKEKREKIRNICFKYNDGNSSERIYQYLMSHYT